MAETSTTRLILRKYRAIIIAVTIFAICDIGVMGTNFYSSFQIAESAVSINLSGRQRMLSQRTTKALLLLQDDIGRGAGVVNGDIASLNELRFVVPLFNETLRGFRDGATVRGGDLRPVFLVQVETPASEDFVRETYEIWEPYLEKLRPLFLRTDGTVKIDYVENEKVNYANSFNEAELAAAVTYARENNLKILNLMNDLTTDLETVADQRAVRLRIIQLVGLTIALFNVIYTLFKSISDLVRGDRELTKARKETTEILSTVKEGLFLIDREHKLGSQFSESLSTVLRRNVEPEMPFLPILKSMVPQAVYDNTRDYIELLFGDRVKESLVADLNPLNEVEVEDNLGVKRYLNFNFNRVLEGGAISHLLVTVQDVTERVSLERQLDEAKDRSRKEVEVLLNLLQKEPEMLHQFFNTTKGVLEQINERLRNDDSTQEGRMHLLAFIMRAIHGIKGEAAALGAEMFESYAHGFEQELSVMRDRGEVRGEDFVRITVLLDGFYERLTSLSGIITRSAAKAKDHTPSAVSVEEQTELSFKENIEPLIRRIATDSGRDVSVVFDIADIGSLPKRIVRELNSIAIQLVRNAVKHGIETPQEREAHGKPRQGLIQIACHASDATADQYEFFVRDDGCGISVARIREKLVSSGQMAEEQAKRLSAKELIMKIFEPGFSTASEADRDAGRGVGMDVISEKVLKINGRLVLDSKVGEFTEFRVLFEA